MAEQAVREQFDRLEDIGRSRQELARVERSLEEGKTAVAVGGTSGTPLVIVGLADAVELAQHDPGVLHSV